MPTWLTPSLFLLQMLLSFLATVLLIEGLYALWRTRRGPDAVRLAARLQTLAGRTQRDPHASLLKQEALSAVPALRRWLLPVPATAWLARWMLQAGLTVPVTRLLLLGLMLGLAGLLMGLWLAHGRSLPLGGLLPGLLLGGTLAALPVLYVVLQRARRLKEIARQLPDALDLMVRSLRAGHSLGSGLKLAGEQVGGPLALELLVLHDDCLLYKF
ncbi:MAG: pilus assembly protein TadB, partial [Rhodoferax sp.]|nr:pilus assembly protein TadB [Rhodoferax sp.]